MSRLDKERYDREMDAADTAAIEALRKKHEANAVDPKGRIRERPVLQSVMKKKKASKYEGLDLEQMEKDGKLTPSMRKELVDMR